MFRQIKIEDMCMTCSNYYRGDRECMCQHYLDDDMVTVECDDYKEGEPKVSLLTQMGE